MPTAPSLPMRALLALVLAPLLVSACARNAPPTSLETIRAFGPADTPVTATGVTAEEGGWKIVRDAAGSVPLFEVPVASPEECRLVYRAKIRTQGLAGAGYLEMWVRVAGFGEAFSRGLDQPVTGDTGWVTREIPFFLKKGEKADLVKLGFAFGGAGTVWIRDVELLRGALPK